MYLVCLAWHEPLTSNRCRLGAWQWHVAALGVRGHLRKPHNTENGCSIGLWNGCLNGIVDSSAPKAPRTCQSVGLANVRFCYSTDVCRFAMGQGMGRGWVRAPEQPSRAPLDNSPLGNQQALAADEADQAQQSDAGIEFRGAESASGQQDCSAEALLS